MIRMILLDKDKLFRIWGIKETSYYEVNNEIICILDGIAKTRFVGVGNNEESALKNAIISIQSYNFVSKCSNPNKN